MLREVKNSSANQDAPQLVWRKSCKNPQNEASFVTESLQKETSLSPSGDKDSISTIELPKTTNSSKFVTKWRQAYQDCMFADKHNQVAPNDEGHNPGLIAERRLLWIGKEKSVRVS